jgi:hypothetical protein
MVERMLSVLCSKYYRNRIKRQKVVRQSNLKIKKRLRSTKCGTRNQKKESLYSASGVAKIKRSD